MAGVGHTESALRRAHEVEFRSWIGLFKTTGVRPSADRAVIDGAIAMARTRWSSPSTAPSALACRTGSRRPTGPAALIAGEENHDH